MSTDTIIAETRHWVDTFVIGLNLCPFARREVDRDRLRILVTEADSALALASVLEQELDAIRDDAAIGTTLIVHPKALADFGAYLDFLAVADQVLVEKELEGDIQIASFHPDYQFAGTRPDDLSNFTNRSPYPMLHLIREADVEQAALRHPDVQGIPARNIALMNELGLEKLNTLRKG
ncbi:MAG: DUF1415 domain-containing protein [Rhodothermales bacterium]